MRRAAQLNTHAYVDTPKIYVHIASLHYFNTIHLRVSKVLFSCNESNLLRCLFVTKEHVTLSWKDEKRIE